MKQWGDSNFGSLDYQVECWLAVWFKHKHRNIVVKVSVAMLPAACLTCTMRCALLGRYL